MLLAHQVEHFGERIPVRPREKRFTRLGERKGKDRPANTANLALIADYAFVLQLLEVPAKGVRRDAEAIGKFFCGKRLRHF
jgi:hypothetical protein